MVFFLRNSNANLCRLSVETTTVHSTKPTSSGFTERI